MRRMMAAGAVAVLFGLAGCGSDDSADSAPTTRAATTTEASTTVAASTTARPTTTTAASTTARPTTTPAAASTTGATPTTKAAAQDGPAAVLPTLADLPSGWSLDPSDDGSGEDDNDDCISQVFVKAGFDFDTSNPPPNFATASFSKAQLGPFLSAAVLVDADVDMDDVFAQFESGLAAGDGSVDADGTTTNVLTVSFPDVGDHTYAARLDINGGENSFPASALYVIASSGNSITFVFDVTVGGGEGDAALVEDVTRTMIGRL